MCKVESCSLCWQLQFSIEQTIFPISCSIFFSSHKDYLQIENRLVGSHTLLSSWTAHHNIIYQNEKRVVFEFPYSSFSFPFVFQFLLILQPQKAETSLWCFTPVFLLAAFQNLIGAAAALHKSKISQANFSSLFYTKCKIIFIQYSTLKWIFFSWSKFKKSRKFRWNKKLRKKGNNVTDETN